MNILHKKIFFFYTVNLKNEKIQAHIHTELWKWEWIGYWKRKDVILKGIRDTYEIHENKLSNFTLIRLCLRAYSLRIKWPTETNWIWNKRYINKDEEFIGSNLKEIAFYNSKFNTDLLNHSKNRLLILVNV